MALSPVLTLAEIAAWLGIRRSRLRAWVDEGEFPAPRQLPHGVRRWLEEDVAAWLAGRTQAATTEQAAVPVQLSTLALEILQALCDFAGRGREWVNAAEIAEQIGGECSHTGGGFRAAITQLKEGDHVHSDRTRGYCLTVSGTQLVCVPGHSRDVSGTQSGHSENDEVE